MFTYLFFAFMLLVLAKNRIINVFYNIHIEYKNNLTNSISASNSEIVKNNLNAKNKITDENIEQKILKLEHEVKELNQLVNSLVQKETTKNITTQTESQVSSVNNLLNNNTNHFDKD